ncbi:hypothetical protein T11_13052 [Trichinella zimbabwensis]|uniref:Uncharacterized protein n=1 Tax=Trichinella zimbabwensis TaxID=268475 RepID=A0A0V1HDP5_9BILA|nr:hypothetical protein T11_13052 [Trichinella zimbabwensis]
MNKPERVFKSQKQKQMLLQIAKYIRLERRMKDCQMNLQKFPEYQFTGKSKIKVMLMQSTSRLKNSGMTKVLTPHPNCNKARGLETPETKTFSNSVKTLAIKLCFN